MPLPFTRVLQLSNPLMTGDDVFMMQKMLARAVSNVPASRNYDDATAAAVAAFKAEYALSPADNVFDAGAAALLLTNFSADGYVDDGVPPVQKGFLYKVLVPVHRNRSIETTATLIAGNGSAIYSFTVRAHGIDAPPAPAWPYFNSCCDGLNQFSSDGMTPTGLILFDLNSPEDNSTEFGPYPVNRAVQGIEGNAEWLIPSIRDGILMHTGDWADYSPWRPGMPMPNSLGCLHAYPDSIYSVWQLLTRELGVQVRPNTNGQLPYPYQPQGLLSIFCVDC